MIDISRHLDDVLKAESLDKTERLQLDLWQKIIIVLTSVCTAIMPALRYGDQLL